MSGQIRFWGAAALLMAFFLATCSRVDDLSQKAQGIKDGAALKRTLGEPDKITDHRSEKCEGDPDVESQCAREIWHYKATDGHLECRVRSALVDPSPDHPPQLGPYRYKVESCHKRETVFLRWS